MSTSANLRDVRPTVKLASTAGGLQQAVCVTVHNPHAPTVGRVVAKWTGGRTEAQVRLPSEESVHELLIPEPEGRRDAEFRLLVDGKTVDRRRAVWGPPPHLCVHVVQRSHHDVGYTNLPSTVRREHSGFLADALEFAAATADYPPDARFRLVIEQAWSLLDFSRAASFDCVAWMGKLLQQGDFELTALFGNLTTEICGPEELVRALYPAARLARRFGVPLVSAEHNDVPGMSWGLAEVLSGIGIRLFCPHLPRYWSWCDPPMQGFWDESVLFPQGRPGGFWWEAPSGGRVLLWDSHGAGGDVDPALPGLAERLQALVEGGYPYATVYWPVGGGARDNPPYIPDFCDTVRDWNARWASPRLVVSTNARFHADVQRELPESLPVFRGELPGQDYPVGAMSTAAATATNRNTHAQLLVGERLAALAAQTADHEYPTADLDRAYEEALWFDEHTWGHHFPAGPAAEASSLEKQAHAYRAAALAHDVTARALARLADSIELPAKGLFLVVHNPLPHPCTGPVVTPLREIENCGSSMTRVRDPEHPEAPGHLRGVPLTDRWHLHPPAEIVAGHFELIDLATGAPVDFEIAELTAESPLPYAPQRHGLAQGGKRYGFFEAPAGLGRDLCFIAQDLPACGYKTYELRPSATRCPAAARREDLTIENEYYRVQADRDTGHVVSVIDREADRELLDPEAPHGLGELVVRNPEGTLAAPSVSAVTVAEVGPVQQRLQGWSSAPGHPQVHWRLALHEGCRRLDLAVRVLKDPTPLLDAHLAFPFAFGGASFRYESLLALQTPPDDFLPGAYWDEVAVQNWVRISDAGLSLLWSSLDAPLVSLGRLMPGYTSPAHRCRVPDDMVHPPGAREQLRRGRLYSLLCANNFGTNFAVSQTASLLFRYRLTTRLGEMSDAEAVRLGWEAVTPPETTFAEHRRYGVLPPAASLLAIEGDPLVLLACKRPEEGRGLVVRLWNPTAQPADSTVRFGFGALKAVRCVSPIEEENAGPNAEAAISGPQRLAVRVGPRAVATLKAEFQDRVPLGMR